MHLRTVLQRLASISSPIIDAVEFFELQLYSNYWDAHESSVLLVGGMRIKKRFIHHNGCRVFGTFFGAFFCGSVIAVRVFPLIRTVIK